MSDLGITNSTQDYKGHREAFGNDIRNYVFVMWQDTEKPVIQGCH